MVRNSLDNNDKNFIHELKKKGFTQNKIAQLYDVSQSTINKVLNEYAPDEKLVFMTRGQKTLDDK
jgi:predicted transcriptional regulator